MRRLTVLFLLLLTAVSAIAGNSDQKEEIEKLKTEAVKEDANDQVKSYTKIAQLQLKELSQAYDEGNNGAAQSALHDILEYGVKAAQTAQDSRKRMKQTEIAIRKLSDKLDDIGKSLSFEERQPVMDAVNKLQAARESLLHAIFRRR